MYIFTISRFVEGTSASLLAEAHNEKETMQCTCMEQHLIPYVPACPHMGDDVFKVIKLLNG